MPLSPCCSIANFSSKWAIWAVVRKGMVQGVLTVSQDLIESKRFKKQNQRQINGEVLLDGLLFLEMKYGEWFSNKLGLPRSDACIHVVYLRYSAFFLNGWFQFVNLQLHHRNEGTTLDILMRLLLSFTDLIKRNSKVVNRNQEIEIFTFVKKRTSIGGNHSDGKGFQKSRKLLT